MGGNGPQFSQTYTAKAGNSMLAGNNNSPFPTNNPNQNKNMNPNMNNMNNNIANRNNRGFTTQNNNNFGKYTIFISCMIYHTCSTAESRKIA